MLTSAVLQYVSASPLKPHLGCLSSHALQLCMLAVLAVLGGVGVSEGFGVLKGATCLDCLVISKLSSLRPALQALMPAERAQGRFAALQASFTS